MHSDDLFAPVLYLDIINAELEDKEVVDYDWKLELLKEMPFENSCTSIEFQEADKMIMINSKIPIESHIPVGKVTTIGPFTAISLTSASLMAPNLEQETRFIMDELKSKLQEKGLSFTNIVLMTVYIQDMTKFNAFNNIYSRYFGSNPAPRVTVQTNIQNSVQIELLAFKDDKKIGFTKDSLHVQGVSYWAPANIGYLLLIDHIVKLAELLTKFTWLDLLV